MSEDMPDPGSCALLQDDLAELSLGTLNGRRRSEVLAHVASCAQCTASLERLSEVADALLLLAPEVEPPLGFETRLAEKLQPAPRRRRHRVLQASVLAAAAVILVALGFFLGARTAPGAPHTGPQAAGHLATANLTSRGRVLGEVLVTRNAHSWMFMTLDAENWSGKVTCEVTLAGGKVDTIGVFTLSGGYGAWSAPLGSPATKVRSARLVAPDGAVIASARLSA